MSRHHHRFERDYRGPWERRDVRPTGIHNGGVNHSCASAIVNGNNRPGLLPLPVIPSLLPTPVTVAVTTSSSDIAVKRGITAAGSGAPASAKVRTLLSHRTSNTRGKYFTLVFVFRSKHFPVKTLAFLLSLSHRPSSIFPILQGFLVCSWHGCPHGSAVRSHPLCLSLLPPATFTPHCCSLFHGPFLPEPFSFYFSLSLPNGRNSPSLPLHSIFFFILLMTFDIGFIG